MMSGGVLDVEPSLIRWNTLGNGKKPRTQNLKGKCQMVVVGCDGGLHLTMRKWNDGLCESMLKWPSLSSRNTLGDASHNSNKLKQIRVKLGWRKCMVGKPMRKLWWWLMKKQPSLSSLNTLGDSSHYSNNLKCYGEQNGLGCGSRWW